MMLYFYVFAVALGTFQTGWAIFGNTQTAPVFIQKFGWNPSQAKLYTTLISNASIVGLFVGSLLGGKVIQSGRRKAILAMNAIIFVGTGFTLVLSVPTLLFGRFICGCACGVFNICMSKSIYESVPPSRSSIFEPMTNISICVAGVICLFLGLALPDQEINYVNDQNWRIIYGFPIVWASAQLFLMITVFKYEPVSFLIANKKDDEVMQFLPMLYSTPYAKSEE
jgi:MFS family permease